MVENYRSCKNIVDISNKFVQGISDRMKQELCTTHKPNGTVNITKYNTANIEIPLIDKLLKDNPKGTTCIMAKTNTETFNILSLLKKNNIPAKLIQSDKAFKLINLYEIKFFIDFIKNHDNPITISDELWKESKEAIETKFNKNDVLPIILNALKIFEETNETKYVSDLETFFYESSLEDFYEIKKEEITVSTIHKAKGREFDNVYLMIKDYTTISDKERREIYVGMTRAKNSLNIFYNHNVFDEFSSMENINFQIDTNNYPELEEITISTCLHDVFLSFFKNKTNDVLKLRKGSTLYIGYSYYKYYLYIREYFRRYYRYGERYYNKKEILRFSNLFQYRLKKDYFDKGYKLVSATVEFIVYWKDDEDDIECPIILPKLKFKKASNGQVIPK
jgi:ATP-dependent DNA helicase RecQ